VSADSALPRSVRKMLGSTLAVLIGGFNVVVFRPEERPRGGCSDELKGNQKGVATESSVLSANAFVKLGLRPSMDEPPDVAAVLA